jgi:hypothetical protein
MFKQKDTTMKKIYQNPTIKIVRIATQRLLADSLQYGRSTTETSGNLSRRGGSIWDDEDEEY